MILAGIVGLVVGAVLVGAAWLATSLVGGSKNGDAGTACAILDRVSTPKDLSYTYAERISAAASLTDAAARENSRYTALADAAKEANQAVQYADVAKAADRVRAARKECGRL